MITTLNKIRVHQPCKDGWEKLLKHLNKAAADDKPLSIATILDSNGLDDALWCLRAVKGRDQEIRLYTVWCVRRVQHLMTDHRSISALDVAERFARGQATDRELSAAAARAAAAAEAAWAAAAAAAADARAAVAARAEAAAAADARAAVAASWATAAARAAAAAEAAWAAESAAQAAELRRICREIEAGQDPYPEEGKP